MYDKPTPHFKPLLLDQKLEFLSRIDWYGSELVVGNYPNNSPFTLFDGNNIKPTKNPPLLIISSTSWTPDEDFSILIKALKSLKPQSRKLLVVITGKGPLKDAYMDQLSEIASDFISVKSAWLSPEDYPRLVACADLGLSLHSSSSGVDLPMKVVDMFGCRVPVLALNFPTIGELVQHGKK